MVLFDENAKKQQANNNVLDEKNIITKKDLQNKKKVIKSSFADLTTIVDITNDDFFELRQGNFLDIIQIQSKDIYSLNESDSQLDIQNLCRFLLTYVDDLKIIPLNMSLNLDKQKEYILRKLEKNENDFFKPFLKNRLIELKNLEDLRTNREYFIFIYDDSENKLLEKRIRIKNLLSRSNPVIPIDRNKRINIITQILNPNTKPINEF